jgi:hypothetical protein
VPASSAIVLSIGQPIYTLFGCNFNSFIQAFVIPESGLLPVLFHSITAVIELEPKSIASKYLSIKK